MSAAHMAVAVRNNIRLHADYTGPPDFTHRIDVEWDERAPAAAGSDFYIMVTPGDEITGEYNDNGQTSHIEVGINVAIAIRAPVHPRDRQRELWIATSKSFMKHKQRIQAQVDFDYTVMNNANTQMIADSFATGDCDTFITPLRLHSVGPIRPASAEIFAGVTNDPEAALIQTMRYRGAMLLVSR